MVNPVHLDFLGKQSDRLIIEYLQETTPEEFKRDVELMIKKYADKREIKELLKQIEKLC